MAAAGEPPKPIRLFHSYSHKDERLLLKLQEHLTVLKRSGLIAEWNDRGIEAGAEWEKEIDRHLSSADIILLLISASFIASQYCWSVEVKKALERHERGEARVILVILRPCRWQSTPFARLQATPKDAKPVTEWPDPDAAFDDVVSKIEAVVLELQRKHASSPVIDPAKPPSEERDAKPETKPEKLAERRAEPEANTSIEPRDRPASAVGLSGAGDAVPTATTNNEISMGSIKKKKLYMWGSEWMFPEFQKLEDKEEIERVERIKERFGDMLRCFDEQSLEAIKAWRVDPSPASTGKDARDQDGGA